MPAEPATKKTLDTTTIISDGDKKPEEVPEATTTKEQFVQEFYFNKGL